MLGYFTENPLPVRLFLTASSEKMKILLKNEGTSCTLEKFGHEPNVKLTFLPILTPIWVGLEDQISKPTFTKYQKSNIFLIDRFTRRKVRKLTCLQTPTTAPHHNTSVLCGRDCVKRGFKLA